MLFILFACSAKPNDTALGDTAFAGDPAGMGPFAVSTQTTTVEGPTEPLDAIAWVPEGEGEVQTVILMPGFLATPESYAGLAEHLASWGWQVFGFTFSSNSMAEPADHDADAVEASAVLDHALTLDRPADPDRVVFAGHSRGGKIAVLGAIRDPRVAAVVAWDPVDSGGAPCSIDPDHCNDFSVAPNSYEGDTGQMAGLTVPFLLFGAPPGAANPEEHNAERFWEGAQAPATYLRFPEGGHTDWLLDGDVAAITARTEVPWLARTLLGQTGTEPWLEGEVLAADVDAGRVERFVK